MCPPDASQNVTCEYPSEPPALPLVRNQVDELLEASTAGREKRWDIRLAVTEACSNVIRHAYPASGGTFQVSTELTHSGLGVTVRDAGRGTVGRIVPRVGLVLAYEASDDLVLEDARPGLIVRMSFSVR